MQVGTYLNFDGDCEAAFNYYAEHLGGKVVAMMKFADGPMAQQVAPQDRDRIMHAKLELGGHAIMGTDCTQDRPYQPIRCVHVVLGIDDPARAERLFAALAASGRVEMPFQQTFWAYRFGVVTDRFGVPWMINCEKAP